MTENLEELVDIPFDFLINQAPRQCLKGRFANDVYLELFNYTLRLPILSEDDSLDPLGRFHTQLAVVWGCEELA